MDRRELPGRLRKGSPQTILSFILHHQPEIIHHGKRYSLHHLTDASHAFSWQAKSGETCNFVLEIRYSNHCYSDAKLPLTLGCATVPDRGTQRVFCPSRYAQSFKLPIMFSNLANRPTTRVGVLRQNFNVFEIQTDGMLYYAFFSLRPFKDESANRGRLNLFVESAYERPDKVPSRRKIPFGMLAESVASGAKL